MKKKKKKKCVTVANTKLSRIHVAARHIEKNFTSED